jgi:hypothetical protein
LIGKPIEFKEYSISNIEAAIKAVEECQKIILKDKEFEKVK